MSEIEELITPCAYCGEPVVSLWEKGGGLLSCPQIVLAGDLLFHAACWDRQMTEHPPETP